MAAGDLFKSAVTKAGLDAARESAEGLKRALQEAKAAADALKPPPTPSQAAANEIKRLAAEAREAEAAFQALAKAQSRAEAAGSKAAWKGLKSFSAGGPSGPASPWATTSPSAIAAGRKGGGPGATSGGAKATADAASKSPAEAAGSAFKTPKDLKYILKHAGIGKAAMGAMGAAAGLELTKLALGYRGMAMLGAVSQRTGLQIRSLFSGVNPMPAVRAFDTLSNQIFNKAGPAGKALGSIFEHTFNGLFGALEKAEPYIQAFFEGAIVGALKMETAYYELRLAALPLTDALDDAIGPMMSIEGAAAAGGLALAGMAIYAAAAAAPFIPLAAAILAVTKALEQAVKLKRELEGGGGVGASVVDMVNHFGGSDSEDAIGKRARENFDRSEAQRKAGAPQVPSGAAAAVPGSASATPAGMATGKDYMSGVQKGVASGQPGVDAAGAAAAAGLDASARGALKIKSPSRVGEDTGGQYPAGLARGVEKRAPEAQDAMRDAATPPKDGIATQSTGGAGGGSFPAEALALLRQIAENTRPRSGGGQRSSSWGEAVHTVASVLGVDHGLAGA